MNSYPFCYFFCKLEQWILRGLRLKASTQTLEQETNSSFFSILGKMVIPLMARKTFNYSFLEISFWQKVLYSLYVCVCLCSSVSEWLGSDLLCNAPECNHQETHHPKTLQPWHFKEFKFRNTLKRTITRGKRWCKSHWWAHRGYSLCMTWKSETHWGCLTMQ